MSLKQFLLLKVGNIKQCVHISELEKNVNEVKLWSKLASPIYEEISAIYRRRFSTIIIIPEKANYKT